MAAMIAAIGLSLLVGIAGQLSLAHAFFVAIGAYGYATSRARASRRCSALLARRSLLAGLAGAAVQPDRRPRARHLPRPRLARPGLPRPAHPPERHRHHRRLQRASRSPPFSLFGFSFSNTDPDDARRSSACRTGALERLWYLGVVLVALALWYGRNLVRSRPGRALATLRDSEVAAAVMGVDVVRYKAAAFTVSSMYAGLGGVLMALAFGRIVPGVLRLPAVASTSW